MLRTFARRAAIAAVPLITLPVFMLAAAPGTALASAPAATIQFQGQAQLLANDSIVVTLDVSCNSGFANSSGFISADASQATAAGQGSATVPCDDQKHTVTLDIAPGPFTPGTASAFAQVTNASLMSVSTQAELKVS